MGRNDEDISSVILKMLKLPQLLKLPKLVLWLDNCSTQNKNWTLLTMLAGPMMDMPEGSRFQYVTLKFFEAGHTFMSADSFHALAEKKFRKAGNLYDFCDYISCLRSAGNAMEKWKWPKGTSRAGSHSLRYPVIHGLFSLMCTLFILGGTTPPCI